MVVQNAHKSLFYYIHNGLCGIAITTICILVLLTSVLKVTFAHYILISSSLSPIEWFY